MAGAGIGRFFMSWDKNLNTDTIEEFRRHLEASLRSRLESLQEDYDTASADDFYDPEDLPGYKFHLEEQMSDAVAVQELAYELSIVALYRKVELHCKRVAKKTHPDLDTKNLSNINTLLKAIPFEIQKLENFAAFDELRLLNNCVKHEGRISSELAQKFPFWTKGEEIKNLDKAYIRLMPLVKTYVRSFVSALYANSNKYK